MTAFSAALRSAMTRRQLVRADVARETGACTTLVKRWMAGACYPDHRTVIALADLLHAPHLVSQSIADRSGTCEACGKATMATRGSTPPRFCGHRCMRRTADRRKFDRQGSQERKVLRRSLEEHREAVAAFCGDCTQGEGLCRDDECLLRPVSPLAFVPLSRVTRRAA